MGQSGPANRLSFEAKQSALALYLLLLFTTAAAVLRMVGLNAQLWCDEIVTLVNAVRQPTQTLVSSYFYDNQHTFYALLAQLSVAVFGEHPWTIRLPAMVFGTVSVPVLYWLGRELTERAEALIAAGLLAVSYHHIWFSQNARGYTALLLATLLATWCFVRGLRGPGWRPWLLYAVTVALGMYTHLTMIFVALSHALVCGWLLLRPSETNGWRTDWRRPLAGFLLAGTLTLLLYAPMLADVQNFFLHKPTGMKAVSTPRWAVVEAWNMLQKGLGGNALVAVPALLSAGLIMGCGLGSYWRRERIVLALFVLPGIITLLGALAARGTMYPRFFFYLLGFGLLIVARGITIVTSGAWRVTSKTGHSSLVTRHASLLRAGLAALLMACFAASLGANYRYPKQDFEDAMNYVEAEKKDGEPVFTAGTAATFCYQRYYHRPWEEARTAGQLATICGTHPVWLVYTFPRYLEAADADLAALIRERFTLVRSFSGTLGGGAVLVCRADPAVGIRH
jgi:mannosyltransferase